MSADAYRSCPECEKNQNKDFEEKKAKLNKKYGKMDMEEFLAAHDKLAKEITKELEETLREDYEIGIWNGEFNINYSAHCSECGFSFTVNEKKDILKENTNLGDQVENDRYYK